jgi:(E)-4-hydroxy-3-methylbut-2-enyl-diphosphate synthase
MERRASRKVKIGNIYIGADEPVAVQSMLTADTKDTGAAAEQINRLYEAGCDIIRLAIVDAAAAKAFGVIKKKSPIPMVADIHFDHTLALMCIAEGADKIRINPGNIGGSENVFAVANAAKQAGIPIRIGVNSGSLEKEILEKYGNTPKGMVESAKAHARLLEEAGFFDIVISLKSSSVVKTVEAYRLMARACDYPLHLGVTEAGTAYMGIIKSAAGIGSLLIDGIGDTLRVSLTAPVIEEVVAGKAILAALDISKGASLVSCPTCGRCKINLFPIAEAVEDYIKKINKPVKVAVMGCVVNGPGEAKDADIGIAGGNGKAVLFKKGKVIKTVNEQDILHELFSEIDKL